MDRKPAEIESDGISRHIFDVGITFFATIASTFLSFLLTIILARYLGATELGVYRLALTTYAIIMLFVASALPAGMIKYVAEFQNDSDKLSKFISSGLVLAGVFSIICMLILYLLSDFIAQLLQVSELSDLIKTLVIIIPFSLLTGVLNGYLNGMRMMKLLAISTVFQSCVMILLSLLFISWNFGLKGIIWGLIIATISNFFLLWFYIRFKFNLDWASFLDTAKILLLFGLPVIASNLVGQVNSQLDSFFIGIYLTPADVGIYSIAWSFSSFIWLFPLSIQRITYPLTSQLWSLQKKQEIIRILNLTLKVSSIFLVFCGLVLVFFGKEIIGLLFTDQFSPAYIPLVILLIGTIIRGVVISIGSTVAAIGKPGIDFISSVIMCISWIILDILLIPRFGIFGTAISASIALTIGTIFSIYYIKMNISIEFGWKWYGKIFFCIPVLIFIYYLLSIFLSHYFGAFFVLFLFLIITYKSLLTNSDQMVLHKLFHGIRR